MLDPQARALLDLMIERGVPPTHTLAPTEARRLYRERRSFTQPSPLTMAEVRDLTAPGRPARSAALLPSEHGRGVPPVLVYYHGGGWMIGDLDTHDVLCRELAHRCRLRGGRGGLSARPRASAFRRPSTTAWRHALGARTGSQRSASTRHASRSAATAPAATWPPWSALACATPAASRRVSSC